MANAHVLVLASFVISGSLGSLGQVVAYTLGVLERGSNDFSIERRERILGSRSVLTSDLTEDQALGDIAAALIVVRGYAAQLAGGVQVRNRLVEHRRSRCAPGRPAC